MKSNRHKIKHKINKKITLKITIMKKMMLNQECPKFLEPLTLILSINIQEKLTRKMEKKTKANTEIKR